MSLRPGRPEENPTDVKAGLFVINCPICSPSPHTPAHAHNLSPAPCWVYQPLPGGAGGICFPPPCCVWRAAPPLGGAGSRFRGAGGEALAGRRSAAGAAGDGLLKGRLGSVVARLRSAPVGCEGVTALPVGVRRLGLFALRAGHLAGGSGLWAPPCRVAPRAGRARLRTAGAQRDRPASAPG